MEGNNKVTIPKWVAVLIVLVFLVFRLFSDQMGQNTLLLFVAVVFMIVFGFLGWLSLKEWRKSDEEILAGYTPTAEFFSGSGRFGIGDRVKQFSGFLVIAALFLFNSKEFPGKTSRYILIGISALLLGIPLILSLRKKEPKQGPKRITGEQIAALIVGLMPTAFLCCFIGIGIYHGTWWFVLPPGLVFLGFFTRPLVAAIRSILKNREDIDPWDRPDIQQ